MYVEDFTLKRRKTCEFLEDSYNIKIMTRKHSLYVTGYARMHDANTTDERFILYHILKRIISFIYF